MVREERSLYKKRGLIANNCEGDFAGIVGSIGAFNFLKVGSE